MISKGKLNKLIKFLSLSPFDMLSQLIVTNINWLFWNVNTRDRLAYCTLLLYIMHLCLHYYIT